MIVIRGLVRAMNPPTRVMGLTGMVDDIGATIGLPTHTGQSTAYLTFP